MELVDKTAGAIIALVAGSIGLILCILTYFRAIWFYGFPPSFLWVIITIFFIPPIMVLVSGIVGLAVGSEK